MPRANFFPDPAVQYTYMFFPMISFVLWRIALCIPLIVAERTIPFRRGFEYILLWHFTYPYSPVNKILWYPWANFDGVHYLSIAAFGYTQANSRFFPLFPFLIGTLSSIFHAEPYGGVEFFIGIFITTICFVIGLYIFFTLIRIDYPQAIARQSLLFLLVFPTSFFFTSIYSESLFFLLSVLAFYAARRKKWWLAAVCGGLLSITRIVGISIFPALLYEYSYSEKKTLLKAFPLLLIPFSFLGFMLFNLYSFKNALTFLHFQTTLGNGRTDNSIVLLPQTVVRYLKILTSLSSHQYEWRVALFELIMFCVIATLLVIGYKKVRTSYMIFAALCFLIPSLSGTFSGLPRYSLVLFPLFITLASLQNNTLKIIYITVSSVLLILLLMLFTRGYYVA